MVRRNGRREEYTELSIRVEGEARVEAGLNISLIARRPLPNANHNEPVFSVTTRLQIRGRAVSPETRVAEPYDISHLERKFGNQTIFVRRGTSGLRHRLQWHRPGPGKTQGVH
jgi:hypothetical protein